MKAIISIELEIDGKWEEDDKEKLQLMIMDNPGDRVWQIDEDRLNIVAVSLDCAVVE